MYCLYDLETGKFEGYSRNPQAYPHLGYTDIPAPDYLPEENQSPFFIDGAWEIRDAG